MPILALVFDVFGTVVDWRRGVAAEVEALARGHGVALDGGAFADAWRAGYMPSMQQVRDGRLPWTTLDGLHRMTLDALLAERGLHWPEPDVADLNQAWHRLPAWPDAVAGLRALKARWPIATLSNGHLALLLGMARHAGLPWDALLSAELFGHYKPDPEVYLGAARLLGVQPRQLMMVAAHPADLRAAAACGLRTALVKRPLERGPGGPVEPWAAGEFDLEAGDFLDLAQRLEAQGQGARST